MCPVESILTIDKWVIARQCRNELQGYTSTQNRKSKGCKKNVSFMMETQEKQET